MPEANIKSVIDNFSKLKVLIIGDIMLDKYIWGETDRISPEAPVPIVLANKKEDRLGGAANVALNIQALGAKPLLCSVVGEDRDGEELIQLFKNAKIDAAHIFKSKKRPTTVKTRIFSKNQQMLRYDAETNDPLNENETKQLLESVNTLLEDTDVIIFQDYDKGVIHEKVIGHIVQLARKKNIPVAVDPKKRNFLFYKDVTLFKPNLQELKDGLNVEINNDNLEQSLEQAVGQLKKKLNQSITLITLASKGIYADDGKTRKLIPANASSISDVSGAGDTVISIAALGLAADLDILLITQLANTAAGLVCHEAGVTPVSKEQLIQEFSHA